MKDQLQYGDCVGGQILYTVPHSKQNLLAYSLFTFQFQDRALEVGS